MPTYEFNLPIDEIVEDAYELVGGDQTGVQDLRSARRSLNLLMIDINNRNIPLSNLQRIDIPLVEGQVEYQLPVEILDVLNVVVQRDGNDLPMTRMSLFDYHQQPTKDQKGRTITYAIDRQEDFATMSVWPVSDNSTDTISAWGFKKTGDVVNYTDIMDIATKYLPAIVFGLGMFLAIKKNPEKVQMLKGFYEEALGTASTEDRERVDIQITPGISGGY